MKTHTLKEFAELHSQSRAGQVLGCTQGNVSQIIASNRKVFITENKPGVYGYYEIKGDFQAPATNNEDKLKTA